jgi:radical SAM superfamily enzyme YgiQ (UPF0313 family)
LWYNAFQFAARTQFVEVRAFARGFLCMKPLRLFLANIGYHTRVFPLVTPPFGLMALAAYLRSRMSVETMIVNQRLDNCTVQEVVRRAVEFGADAVGFSVFTTSSYLLPEVVRLAREALPNALILTGGAHASSVREAVMDEADVDVAVPGEGELATEAVLQTWLGGKRDFSAVPGVIWRDTSGEVMVNPGPLSRIDDLDTLPMPAYDLIDLPAYWKVQSIAPIFRRRYVSLTSSRGCPYNCIWCHKIFGKSIRMHSAERVVDEMSFLLGKYGSMGMRDFEFLDDNFNFSPKRVIDISENLLSRGMRVKLAFPTGLRADLLTGPAIDALADAGMFWCGFALETGSPRLQKYTCKVMNIPKLLAAGEHVTRRGVFCNLYCMLGFPSETEEEIRQTVDTACASPFHTASFFTVTPFPGTALYEFVKERNPEKLKRLRYDDMDFSGMCVNLSDMPDERLFYHQRTALRRFYGNPRRLVRLARSHPQPWMLPAYIPIFLYRASKGMLPFAGNRKSPGRPAACGDCPPNL